MKPDRKKFNERADKQRKKAWVLLIKREFEVNSVPVNQANMVPISTNTSLLMIDRLALEKIFKICASFSRSIISFAWFLPQFSIREMENNTESCLRNLHDVLINSSLLLSSRKRRNR